MDRYWDCLFHDGPWRFAQVAPFDQEQQQAYLGPERYRHLQRLDVQVLAVPRALETIRTLTLEQLDQLRTASDVYWRATQTMLDKAFTSAEVRRAEFTTDSACGCSPPWRSPWCARAISRPSRGTRCRTSAAASGSGTRDQCDWQTQTEFNASCSSWAA